MNALTNESAFPCAQLSVAIGSSSKRSWPLFQGIASHLVIGSSNSCDWRVHARGVRARHWRLSWNGQRARIEDQWTPGAVRVDGHPVAHRVELLDRACIEFGEARLVYEQLPPGATRHLSFAQRKAAMPKIIHATPLRSTAVAALAAVTVVVLCLSAW